MGRERDIKAEYEEKDFDLIKEVFKAGIIQAIEKLGHEVGYHYEVLDKGHTKRTSKRDVEIRILVDIVHPVHVHLFKNTKIYWLVQMLKVKIEEMERKDRMIIQDMW